MGDDRGITYQESSQTIYRASSLGHCPRQLVLSRQSYDPLPYPAPVLTAFQSGNTWEPIILSHLNRNNWAIKGSQDEINLQILPHITIRGHVDGVGWHWIKSPKVDIGLPGLHYADVMPKPGRRSEKVGVEVKALSHENFMKPFSAFPAYQWQLSVYILGLGIPFALVVVDKDNSTPESITYRVDIHRDPPIPRAQIIRRILEVEAHVRQSTLPPCQPDGFFCPYTPYHDPAPEPEQVTDKTLLDLIRKYNVYSSDIKLLSTEQRQVKELILKSFKENQPYAGGGFSWQINQYDKKEYQVKAQTVTSLSVQPDKP